MRLDLSLTYGGEKSGDALHKHCIFYLSSTVFKDQFVKAQLTDPAESLFKPAMISEREQFPLLSICLTLNVSLFSWV